MRPQVQAACNMLGLDPLYCANEGKLLAVVAPADADKVLATMKNHELGTDAAIVGEVTERYPGKLTLRTAFGGSRVLQKLSGAQLPRIC